MTRPWQTPPEGQAAVAADRIRQALPRIARGRVVLRAPYLEDYPAYESIVAGPRGRWIGGPLDPDEAWLDFSQMVAGWVLRGAGLWAVEHQEDGRLLGFVTLHHEAGDPEPELGFFLLPAEEGQGFAFEAAEAARNNAFFALSWPSLVSYIDPDNARAVRLLERLGAVRDESAERAFDGTANAGVAVWRHPRPEAP